MTEEEYRTLKAGDSVELELPWMSWPLRGLVVEGAVLDPMSPSRFGFVHRTRNMCMSWLPRSDGEFMGKVSIRRK